MCMDGWMCRTLKIAIVINTTSTKCSIWDLFALLYITSSVQLAWSLIKQSENNESVHHAIFSRPPPYHHQAGPLIPDAFNLGLGVCSLIKPPHSTPPKQHNNDLWRCRNNDNTLNTPSTESISSPQCPENVCISTRRRS